MHLKAECAESNSETYDMSRLAVHEAGFSGAQKQSVAPARRWKASFPITLLLIVICTILVAGWVNRTSDFLTPREGLGYDLIAGG
jgi:hypothetical protein